MRRSGRWWAIAMVALVLAGCTSEADEPEQVPTREQIVAELGVLAGVETVDVQESATDADTAPSFAITVVVAEQTQADEVAAAARTTHAYLDDLGQETWTAAIVQGRRDATEDEASPSPRLRVDVFPAVGGDPGRDARAAFEAAHLDGVHAATLVRSGSLVTAEDGADLRSVLVGLRALEFWSDGGSLHDRQGRVRVSDLPGKVTDAVTFAILEATELAPEADFAVEASGGWPQLWANRLSADEAHEVVALFTDPALSEPIAGFVPDFNLRSFEGHGTVDVHGTFGQADVTRTPV